MRKQIGKTTGRAERDQLFGESRDLTLSRRFQPIDILLFLVYN
jgi:hypothetical protein